MHHLKLPPTTKVNSTFRRWKLGKGSRADVRLPATVPPSRKQIVDRRLALITTASKAAVVVGGLFIAVNALASVWKARTAAERDTRVSHITILGGLPSQLGGITQGEVRAATGITQESRLADVSLADLRTRLLKLEQLSEVDVEKVPPGEIRITVGERLPLAWLVSFPSGLSPRDTAKGRLIDADMHLLPCRRLTQTLVELPEIQTGTLQLPQPQQPLIDFRTREAVAVIGTFQRTEWPSPLQITLLDVTSQLNTRMELSDGATVYLPVEASAAAIPKLAEIYKYVDQNRPGLRVASVRLQQTRNVAVTYHRTTDPSDTAENQVQPAETPKSPAKSIAKTVNGNSLPTTTPAGGLKPENISLTSARSTATSPKSTSERVIRKLRQGQANEATAVPNTANSRASGHIAPANTPVPEDTIQAILRGA